MARRVLGESHELTLRVRYRYAGTLCNDPSTALDDVREAVATNEEIERIARRVLGGTHPLVTGIDKQLRQSRSALRAREELLAKYLLYGASALAIAAFALLRRPRRR